eukprot:5703822-Amphidinium_carterae.1
MLYDATCIRLTPVSAAPWYHTMPGVLLCNARPDSRRHPVEMTLAFPVMNAVGRSAQPCHR